MEKSSRKGCGCSGCFGCFPFIIFIFIILRTLSDFMAEPEPEPFEPYESEIISIDGNGITIKPGNPDEEFFTSNFSWNYRGSDFRNRHINLTINMNQFRVLSSMAAMEEIEYMTVEDLGITANRDLNPDAYANQFWSGIYRKMDELTGPHVQRIADALIEAGVHMDMDKYELLNLTITMVQSIEYKIPEVYFGIIPPIVSISREYGDCDTTSLLLHSILSRMGYDTTMFYSREYAHAMFGINTPSNGVYKEFKGKKYYFLEATASGWAIGQISPEWDDVEKWHLVNLNPGIEHPL